LADSVGAEVIIFELDTSGAPSLSLVNSLPTGGKGGASTNAGILQFHDDYNVAASTVPARQKLDFRTRSKFID
jgi:hypothetical protein